MKQEYKLYKEEDQLVWKTLFERQVENLQGKSCTAYLSCLEIMKGALNAKQIPDFKLMNAKLTESTGWSIEVVPGLIPVEDFFRLLAQRKFSASTWVRKMDQLDYLFHMQVHGHDFVASSHYFSKLLAINLSIVYVPKGDTQIFHPFFLFKASYHIFLVHGPVTGAGT